MVPRRIVVQPLTTGIQKISDNLPGYVGIHHARRASKRAARLPEVQARISGAVRQRSRTSALLRRVISTASGLSNRNRTVRGLFTAEVELFAYFPNGNTSAQQRQGFRTSGQKLRRFRAWSLCDDINDKGITGGIPNGRRALPANVVATGRRRTPAHITNRISTSPASVDASRIAGILIVDPAEYITSVSRLRAYLKTI